GPGNDWSIVRLAGRGRLSRVTVDTTHFKGNAPGSCVLEGCDAPPGALPEQLGASEHPWVTVVPRTKLLPHTAHELDALDATGPFTHVRLSIFPDGGVARLRVYGHLDEAACRAALVARLNALGRGELESELRACCGASRWVSGVAEARPFGDADSLFATSERVWASLGPDDWHEAFRHHPRIGESRAAAEQSSTARGWSSAEQSGAASAAAGQKTRLAEVNRAYEARFGFIYLVCATGKSAEELLAIAESRLGNDPDAELRIAAAEQAKITRIRLEKLIHPPSPRGEAR
ncbi:MAG: 2-oxo-4-hydroxy-4-carboxy-5-ureidoimidazoline decarboxylase, partial [Deltaproteobacteria bacterium]|nr:2-oxo-4-hydroxy-4-carboxy-5-ureidoimidazoline decarboxylase [Deltaproteobacteria bacterium]